MKYKAVLFDLDGTLLNTLQDIADSVNKGLRSLGFPPHRVEDYKLLVGEGREVLALRALPESNRDDATVEKLLVRINEEYSVHWMDNTLPYDGIPALLDVLTVNHIETAVLSNKADDLTKMQISRLLSKGHFAVVVGARPSMPKKPDPAAALEIANGLGIAPSDFLYLGDSGVDMKTAKRAGMYPVGALWGFRSEDELRADGAAALIKYPSELLSFL
ncbi:MAG: HAD family hydrolase [Dehalococcoidales bacterium]|nr:HAD family hydrolase [Dehalococcoidales bacterium]